MEAEKEEGRWVDPARSRSTFNEIADRWLEARFDKARSTTDRDRSYLRSMIRPYFGERRVASIRPSEIEIWIANLDRAPGTRAKALQIVSSILDLARRDGLIATNPATNAKRPSPSPRREGIALGDQDLRALLSAAYAVGPTAGAPHYGPMRPSN